MIFAALLAAIQVLSNVAIPMRDAVKLAAGVLLPEEMALRPALLAWNDTEGNTA